MSEPLRAISLFSGAGGMDVGFENAGIKVVFANELVADAAETYRANHPDCIMVNDDINNVIDSLGKYEGVDLVFGGPPCQGFSVAGKMDPDDDRSKLIFTFLDVVERVKPRAFVMENVKALGELSKWKDVRERYLKKASDLGYSCHYFVLNATDYGVPQKRERVFFVGSEGIRLMKSVFISLSHIIKRRLLPSGISCYLLAKQAVRRIHGLVWQRLIFAHGRLCVNPLMRYVL